MGSVHQYDKAIDRLQHHRDLFLESIQGLDQVQLDYKPARNSWSVGQIAHHVGLGELVWQGYLKSLLRKREGESRRVIRVSLSEVPFHSRLIPDVILQSPFVLAPVSLMLNLVPRPVQSMLFAVPIFKMEAGSRMQPKLGMSRSRILKFLSESRKDTLELLEPVKDVDLSGFRIIHPLVGDQSVYGVLGLLASHEQRHTLQIESIRKGPGFPQAGSSADS